MSRTTEYVWMILALAPAGLLGCGSTTGRQADPETARTTLQQALDAWQKGEAMATFQGTPPAVTVVEPQWRRGFRLLEYELKGSGEPSGFDHQFAVKLSLQDSTGRKFQEKALYNVSTSPARVIVRWDGAS